MADGPTSRAVISIIIDDIGYRSEEGREMINLPGDLTYAVLPNAPKTKQLANLAHQQGKEGCCICRCNRC
ncbi:MAG: divergent polysaccharide deacetylase family protein [Cycloclasticus sp.]